MSNDLVKRLWESDEASALTNQAARRIEKLKAKLAKAVEALERIASGEFSGRMLTSMPPQDAAQYFARTTLAELKEEDRG
jgi:flagellar motility protein MotE (MotC chaperone)